MKNIAWMSVAGTLLLVLAARGDGPAMTPAKKIPLSSIFSTSGQKELKDAKDAPFIETAKAPGVAAFAWSKDFKSLTKEGLIAATGTKEKPQTLTPPKDGDAVLWAEVYFGATGSSPIQFTIEDVTWTMDHQITVNYKPSADGVMTMDLKPYVAWIPLGRVAAGDYTMQLAVADKVQVEQKWTIAGQDGGQAVKVPASSEQITVQVIVPGDQQMPGDGERRKADR